jgi:hypothetical protein
MRLKSKILTPFKALPLRLWLPILLTLIVVTVLAALVYRSGETTSPAIVLLTPTATATPLAAAAAATPAVGTNDVPLSLAAPEAATPVPQAPTFHLSLAKDAARPLGSVEEARDEDILSYDGTTFAMVFDGSAAGLAASVDVDAFHFLDADTLLLSFDKPVSIGPLRVDDSDIVKFEATSLGLEKTAGTFSLFFDGSTVGLRTSGENVDAFALLPDGALLISTEGVVRVPGANRSLRVENEDILAFAPAEPDDYSSGLWSLYFDGSEAGIKGGSENVDGFAVGPKGELFLTTTGRFSVNSLAGGGEDIFIATSISLENSPAYSFSPTLFFEGSLHGLERNNIDALSIP